MPNKIDLTTFQAEVERELTFLEGTRKTLTTYPTFDEGAQPPTSWEVQGGVGRGRSALIKKRRPSTISQLRTLRVRQYRKWLKELRNLEPTNKRWLEMTRRLAGRGYVTDAEYREVRRKRKQLGPQKAQSLLELPDIRSYLCPPLQSVTNDSLEIAKAITPTIVGLAVAGRITWPVTPLLIASLALIIARMGLATICAGFEGAGKSR